MSNKLIDIAEDSARGGLFLLTGNTLYILISAVGVIITARLLGPKNYGLYSLSLIIPELLASFIDLGINPALIRFSAKLRSEGKQENIANILKTAFSFKLIASLLIFAICYIYSDILATTILNKPDLGFLIKLSSLLILFQTIFNTANSTFIGLDKMENNALTQTLQSITKTTTSPLLILIGFGVIGAILGHILGYITAGILAAILLFKHYRKLTNLEPGINGNFLKNMKLIVSYGFPLYLSTLLIGLQSQYQNIMLALFTSNIEIGNFNAALRFSLLILILVTPISNALFPAFSKINPEGEDVKKLFKLSIKYTSLLIIPASILIATLSRELIYTIYGPTYTQAPLFLTLYVITFLYTALGYQVINIFFNGIGDSKTTFKINLISLASFIPLGLLTTQLYRTPGLIVALLTSNLLATLYALYIAKKKYDMNIDINNSLRIFTASLLSAVPTLLLLHLSPHQPLINAILGGLLYILTYMTLAPLTGAVTQTDIQNLKQIFSKIKPAWPILKTILTYEDKLLSNLCHKS